MKDERRNPAQGHGEASRAATVLLWPFVIDLGIALGAGLYEGRIVAPRWLDRTGAEPVWRAELAREDDTGSRFWVGVTTVPLTLLTLANLWAEGRAPGALRRWWAGAGTALVERALTPGYFIPTMVRLSGASSSPESVAAAARWLQLNNVRHVLVLGAWLAALRTFALLYERKGGN